MNQLAPIEHQETSLSTAGLEHTRQQLTLLENFVSDVLRKDQDYGTIPGTIKPTLLKPGAANIIAAFNCHAEPYCDERTVDAIGSFVSYEHHVDVVHNITGKVMSRGYGGCNSHEVKYRYRDLKRTCPTCNAAAIIKGRKDYGGGWLCWAKQGGCGAKFIDGTLDIEEQPTGRVENEDPLDQMNTYMKMSIKRAEVDAALRLPGVARFFTQDLEINEGAPRDDPERVVEGQPADLAMLCPVHHTEWFKKGRMRQFAHPIEGQEGQWCNQKDVEAMVVDAEQPAAQPGLCPHLERDYATNECLECGEKG